jgi:uncharacterized protein YfiM (DUF2279 family)
LAAVFFCAVIPTTKADETESYFGHDKIKHFAVSFALSTVAYNIFRTQTELSDGQSRLAAFGAALGVGLAKELIDDEFSEKDLVADIAGAGLGVAVGIRFRF